MWECLIALGGGKEKRRRVWRCRVGLGRGGVGDEAIRTDVELRPEDVDSFFFCS